MMFDGGVDESYCGSIIAAATETEYVNRSSPSSTKKTKMTTMKNKKRFSDEQIRSLESIFETDSKLEPRKKVQVARELGLQPRQVAIWFQNKRARFKSKQLEKDYDVLAANYSALASRFEDLKQEKQCLIKQLQKLNEVLNKRQLDEAQCCKTTTDTDNGSGSSTSSSSCLDRQSDDQNQHSIENNNHNRAAAIDNNNYYESAAVMRPALSLDGSEYGMGILSDDGCCSDNTNNYFGMEEGTTTQLLLIGDCRTTMETGEDDEDWDNLHANSLLLDDQSADQWLDFWS